MGPLKQLHDPGLLQSLQQVYDQGFLTDGVCSEPKIHSNYKEFKNTTAQIISTKNNIDNPHLLPPSHF